MSETDALRAEISRIARALNEERALREKAEREWDEARATARAELIAELTRKTDAIAEEDPLPRQLAEERAARERAEATVTGVVTERDAAIKRAEAAEAVVEAAEAFLSFQCSCDVLQDQGLICSVCLLKERFAALDAKP